jgi:predicted DNA-binding protein (UPF0251 family)
VIGKIPFDPRVIESVRKGVPVTSAGASPATEAIQMLRSNLEPELLYYYRGQPEWDGMLPALGVSRRTVWRDIYEVHHKIADALLHGKSLDIGGCLSR